MQMLQACFISGIFSSHCNFILPYVGFSNIRLVRLRQVAADYTARTLHDTEIKYDLMFHDSNLGLTLWTPHTNLLWTFGLNYTAAQ